MKKTLSLALILIFLLGIMPAGGAYAAKSTEKIGAVKYFMAVRDSDTSLKLTWQKVKEASGYMIYRYDRSKNKFRKVATINKNTKTSWVDKDLTKGKVYKYKIRTFKKSGAKKILGEYSFLIKARPYSKSSSMVNAGSVKLNNEYLFLGTRTKSKLKASVGASSFGDAKKKKAINKRIRWRSSNPEVVKVDKKGWITTGTSRGHAWIYATAHNGVRESAYIEVEDFPNPEYFYMDHVTGAAVSLLTDYKDDICKIATYFHWNRPDFKNIPGNEVFFDTDYDDDDNLIMATEPPGYNAGAIMPVIENLLKKFPYPLVIYAEKMKLTFVITEGLPGTDQNGKERDVCHIIDYFYDYDLTDLSYDESMYFDLADRWGYAAITGDDYEEGDLLGDD